MATPLVQKIKQDIIKALESDDLVQGALGVIKK
jgi:hypothetical protein